ncbi:MAG: TonB-dependent receptor [Steroidobacteraceae bacterium]
MSPWPTARIDLPTLAVCLAAAAAAISEGRATEPPAPQALAEIVVTASHTPRRRLEVPVSITRLDAGELSLLGATHHAEALNRIAGVMIQRNSGEESLTAIRSPVLTGAGSCGAFLLLEDGMPIRPVGVCNVNELLEVNFEQAHAIEVVRGPGPAIYGANAVHGIVNVLTPDVGELPRRALALEGGPDAWKRVRLEARAAAGGSELGLYGLATHDGGFRADSGFDEAKLNLLFDRRVGNGTLRVRAAGTVLNQETAGFVRRFDAYRDPLLRRSNPNPEAFRDAWSTRLTLLYAATPCRDCDDDLRIVARRSHMQFLQHFLLGEPLEINGQRSVAISLQRAQPLTAATAWRAGIAAERADSDLVESQSGPTLQGSVAARAIRPAGLHYDYTVTATTTGAHASLDWHLADAWRASAALRFERTHYSYDNRMRDGNTAGDGTTCAFGGCLYSRPADRSDSFTNLAPRFDLSYELAPGQRLYGAWSRGFRPPEATELYRLQRQQSIAELDSERLQSAELGWRAERAAWSASVAAFALAKSHVILRDANGFNVSDGRTTHRGFEYEWRWQLAHAWRLSAAGSVAWHRYAFSRAIEGGETIVSGADIDTAPRHLHGLQLGFSIAQLTGELEVSHVGRYYVDASNAHQYPGHTLVNVRAAWDFAPRLRATLRLVNLFDRRYAERADYANGDYRYAPGRERAAFLEVAYAAR